MVLKNLERGLKAKLEAVSKPKRFLLRAFDRSQQVLHQMASRCAVEPRAAAPVHKAFGGELRAMFTGGAFMEPSTLQFFYDLGVPVANGYGLTEAGTVLTLNDLRPFRADTVGKPLPGVELRVLNPDSEGVGEVAATGKTVMSHYWTIPN
jgi:long-chain acyl-CoA synthetase